MTRCAKLALCLTAMLVGPAFALETDTFADKAPDSTVAAPVAYVYVSLKNGIDAFTTAATGKLTPVKGSPFPGAVWSMSANKKYLFGAGSSGKDVYSYSIASDGALKLVSTTDTEKYSCKASSGPLAIDGTGSTLYTSFKSCGGDGETGAYQAFNIDETNGDLQFVGDSTATQSYSKLVLLGNNEYGYGIICNTEDVPETFTATYKRDSNGFLTYLSGSALPMPAAADPRNDFYCPVVTPPPTGDQWKQDPNSITGDPVNHLAVAIQDFNYQTFKFQGPVQIATYTADSHGNLTTKSTWSNMAKTAEELTVSAISISPTGKLLAVGGKGFQILHFNGGAEVTSFSSLLQPGDAFTAFAWDSDNHLYALGGGKLFVYSVTPTSIKEAPGSPYAISGASSLVVRSIP
jgi:hypothetical protein